MLRLLHTSDWQLAKRFRQFPGDTGAALRLARFQMLHRLGQLAMEHRVAAVLVAGDVFDMSTPREQTLRKAVEILRAYPVPWLLLPGNHDPAHAGSVWSHLRALEPPAHLHLLTSTDPLLLAEEELLVLPAPLSRQRTLADPTEGFGRIESGSNMFRVGLAHGAVADLLPREAEPPNPISRTRAVDAQLDYLALGDWHGTLKLDARTYYSGTPEPDRFATNRSGYALLVELQKGQEPAVSELQVGTYHWHTLGLNLSGDASAAAFSAAMLQIPAPLEHAVVRCRLRGRATLADLRELRRAHSTWQGRVHALAVDYDHVQVASASVDFDALRLPPLVQDVVHQLQRLEQELQDERKSEVVAALTHLHSYFAGDLEASNAAS